FHSDREGGGIYVVSALGGAPRLMIPRGSHPRFSLDGRRLMYFNGMTENRGGLYVTQLPEGPSMRVGDDRCGDVGVWSPDGNRVLYVGDCTTIPADVWIS